MGRPLEPEEDELVARAQAGDVEAYEALVQRTQAIAFRTAYLVTRNAADAEEAAQDGFLKAYRALGRFRRGAPFRPWLLRIVANEARNRRRSAGRRAALALRAAEASSGDAAPSPEATVLDAERRRELLDAARVASATTTGSCSSAASCSTSRRRRPPPCSASAAARSSRAPRARSSG